MILTCTNSKTPAELEEAIPITPKPDGARKVVMSLGRGTGSGTEVPKLLPGDRVRVTAELEVTTDCRESGKGCYRNPKAGGDAHPYEYHPGVSARLLLSGDPNALGAEGETIQLAGPREAEVSHQEHHKLFVFSDGDYVVPAEGLPWDGESYVNLVLDAHHDAAGGGDVLLIGENEPDGSVGRGKGRINLVRRKPECPEGRRLRNDRVRAPRLPIETGRKPVVYSQPVGKLAADEQLVIEATLRTRATGLNYPVRISTRLLLADSPTQWDTGGEASRVARFGGQIAEHNGFNFNLGDDAVADSHKVGVLRAERDSRKDLYVNLVADCGDPFERSLIGDVVEVLEDGYLSVTSFGPELYG